MALLLGAILASAALAEEPVRMAGREARARGVDAYSIRNLGGAIEMQLFRQDRLIGSLWFSIGASDREAVLRTEEVPYLHLRWASTENRFVLRGSDGLTHVLEPDGIRGFTGTEAAIAARDRYSRAGELIGALMTETEIGPAARRSLRPRTDLVEECEIWDASCSRGTPGGILQGGGGSGGGTGGGVGEPTWSCSGGYVRGEAFFSASRSEICDAAQLDAQSKCWNRYCVGCCKTWNCDAYCLVGDYLCTNAGVTGQACGPG
jgi:hypothetical protein